MKYSVITFLILTITGCQTNPEPKNKLHISSHLEFLEINELTTKMDSEGNIQCINYGNASLNDDSILIYGFNIKRTLALLFDIEQKNIHMEIDSLNKVFLEVKYKRFDTTAINRTEIAQRLMNVYNLKSSETLESVMGYELKVMDTNILSQNLSHFSTKQGFNTTRTKLEMPGSTISTFVKVLNGIFNVNIVCENDSPLLYNFDIDFLNLPDLNNELRKQYGLILIPVEKDIRKITILKLTHVSLAQLQKGENSLKIE